MIYFDWEAMWSGVALIGYGLVVLGVLFVRLGRDR